MNNDPIPPFRTQQLKHQLVIHLLNPFKTLSHSLRHFGVPDFGQHLRGAWMVLHSTGACAADVRDRPGDLTWGQEK